MTWYPQEFTKVDMRDMRMRADPASGYPGRSYRFYKGDVVYPFGYGLSYTKYSYKFADVKDKIVIPDMGFEGCERSEFSVMVRVKNEGKVAGKHPVLLFAQRLESPRGAPVKQLLGFKSVLLRGGEEGHLTFGVRPCDHLSRAELDGSKVLDDGSYALMVGDQEHHMRISTSNV